MGEREEDFNPPMSCHISPLWGHALDPMSLSFQRQGLNFPGIAAPKSSNDGTEGNFDVDTGRSLSSTLALDEALRMLHDKVDFHIRRRVRWVPSDASTSIDEFEICARGRSPPDAGDIVVPYAVIDILILLLTQVFHSYTPHGCCPKDYAYSIQRPSHHQIAQGRCRLTLCLTTREEIILA